MGRGKQAVTDSVRDRLLAVLAEVPSVRAGAREADGAGNRVVVVTLSGGRLRLLLRPLPSGEPRFVRAAADHLRASVPADGRQYGVVGAPYIGPRAAEVCKEAGVGFVDLAGNCRLTFGTVFIERSGVANPEPERRRSRTIFAARSSRVVRVLLEKPRGPWQVQTLARKAGVSLGLAFKVKQRLLDMEYARSDQGGLVLARPEELLREWAESYSYTKNSAFDCYGAGSVQEMEAALVALCKRKRIQYALALFSGAARVAAFARYARGFAYADCEAGELVEALGWKPVPSGANFTVLRPFDESVLRGASRVRGEMVASDIQLYLDLAGYKGRGQEAAAAILEQRLRPTW